MRLSTYTALRARVLETWREDYEWAQAVGLPADADVFLSEYCFVVLCSGMKWTVAAKIWQRLRPLVFSDSPLAPAFGHAGKTKSMEHVRTHRLELYAEFMNLRVPSS